MRRHNTIAGVYAHASVGCLHVRPVVNLKTADGVAKFEAIANEVADLVLEFGGALSGEHGDGLVRGAFNEKMFGSELYQAFREVKNDVRSATGSSIPGRIVDTPPITSHLRYGAGLRDAVAGDVLRLLGSRRASAAPSKCAAASGLCRKTREGTMCPSYMVTRDEAHSTRGRANALRLAMAGQLGDAKLRDKGVHEVLDLCLECRACKSECPVGVDVARFKSEFLVRLLGSARRAAQAHGCSAARRPPPHGAAASRRSSNAIANTRSRAGPPRSIAGIDRRRVAAAVDAANVAEQDQTRNREPGAGNRKCIAVRRHLHEPRRSGNRPCRAST